MVQSPTFESEWLDFKGSAKGKPEDNSVKENWAKTLSAFANTEGGVLIWGIDARPDPATNVDAAIALSLVPDTGALVTRLKTLLPTVTDPPVQNVRIEAYNTTAPEGFVVCYIPQSSFKPHRSEPNKQFYIRVADHCFQPSVSWLRKMFMPEIRPLLVPFVEIHPKVISGGGQEVRFNVFLGNEGFGTAYETFIILNTTLLAGLDHQCWLTSKSGERGQAFMAQRPIHPGEIYPFAVLSRVVADRDAVTFSFKLFAKNQEPILASVTISAEEQRREGRVSMQVQPLRR